MAGSYSTGLHILRYLLLLACLCVTSSSDIPVSSFPVPGVHLTHSHYLTKRDAPYSPETHVSVHVPEPGLYSERLDLFLVEHSTSWLEIRWELENRTGAYTGVPKFSRVRYNIGNSTTVLHHVNGPTNRYRIPNLSSNTEYMICVETMERSENYLHCTCSLFRTIPTVRPDSIIGLFLSLGYIFVMALIGYVTWWMRVRKYTANHKYGNEFEMTSRTGTIRFSEIEERAQLNSHPSHSCAKSSQMKSDLL